MAKLDKVTIASVAARLDEPFSMMNVASTSDIVASVYICQGTLRWHKHLDIDELFWVCEGTILLESEWGTVRLRPGELAVVPKGVSHRSSAKSRASVLLLRCGVVPDRKNGRRRIYAISGETELERIDLREAANALTLPLQFHTVARIDGSVVQTARGEGTWPVEVPVSHDVLFFVLSGTATVRTSESMLHLHPGDLTVVPQGAVYQLGTTRATALVRVTRKSPSSRGGGA